MASVTLIGFDGPSGLSPYGSVDPSSVVSLPSKSELNAGMRRVSLVSPVISVVGGGVVEVGLPRVGLDRILRGVASGVAKPAVAVGVVSPVSEVIRSAVSDVRIESRVARIVVGVGETGESLSGVARIRSAAVARLDGEGGERTGSRRKASVRVAAVLMLLSSSVASVIGVGMPTVGLGMPRDCEQADNRNESCFGRSCWSNGWLIHRA